MTRRKRNSSRINKNEGAVHHHTGEEGPSDQDSIGEKFTFAQSEHSLDTDGKNISDLLSGEVNLNDHHEPISNSLSERELNETPDKLENAFNQGEQSDCDTEKPQNEEFAANTPIDIETKIIDHVPMNRLLKAT